MNIDNLTTVAYTAKILPDLAGQSTEFIGMVSHKTGIIVGLGLAQKILDRVSMPVTRTICNNLDTLIKKELEALQEIIEQNSEEDKTK